MSSEMSHLRLPWTGSPYFETYGSRHRNTLESGDRSTCGELVVWEALLCWKML